jgi:hypothetical protein
VVLKGEFDLGYPAGRLGGSPGGGRVESPCRGEPSRFIGGMGDTKSNGAKSTPCGSPDIIINKSVKKSLYLSCGQIRVN